jgi:hypothetical protein
MAAKSGGGSKRAPKRKSAPLTAKKRHSIPKSQFALPGREAYPVDTRKRASNAKSRAQAQYNKGKISKSTRDKIFAKANRKLQS